MNAERIAARRADIDAKQEQIAHLLEELGCEGALLLVPQHVAWFTSGLTCRGLIAETERPAIFTNGRQRWLVASNVDSQRFFDEDLDQLGFQLKEWCWDHGRADLLHSIVAGRTMACDRPISNMVILNEKLREMMKTASEFVRAELLALGQLVAHAVEATARSIQRGDREEEAAGQIGHRLLHHGAEPVAISVTADDRGSKYRRAGFTSQAIHSHARLQATGFRQGLYVTASRTVSFGAVEPQLRTEYDQGMRVAAAFLALSRPGETISTALAAETRLLAGTEWEFEPRLSCPVYGSGWWCADELRRGGQDEPFLEHQPIVWQVRLGAAGLVDSVMVGTQGATFLTAVEDWPVKRVRVGEQIFDLPEILVRS